jgi:hypothetical protein
MEKQIADLHLIEEDLLKRLQLLRGMFHLVSHGVIGFERNDEEQTQDGGA